MSVGCIVAEQRCIQSEARVEFWLAWMSGRFRNLLFLAGFPQAGGSGEAFWRGNLCGFLRYLLRPSEPLLPSTSLSCAVGAAGACYFLRSPVVVMAGPDSK